ncbi:uncharacterized protein METZ01_LOCUS228186, partial [marine metagenome]
VGLAVGPQSPVVEVRDIVKGIKTAQKSHLLICARRHSKRYPLSFAATAS